MAARAEDVFDFLDPDYVLIFKEREKRLKRIRNDRRYYAACLAHYRTHEGVADFITDWGITYDTRAKAKGRPAYIPFILQPKQRELVNQILEWWRGSDEGLVEKSRDQGCSWIAMAVSGTLSSFNRDIDIGFASATEDKVDRSGDPGTLFYKGRMFIDNLPPIFRPRYHSAHMRMYFPATNSSITGGAGENAFRSGRFAIGFVDEAAYIPHPLALESSISAAAPCRIFMSSIARDGMANYFAQKRHSGRAKVFTMHWRDDKRKTEEWAREERAKLDPTVWAADYDIDYSAAAENVIIPREWINAAVDAHVKLRINPTGVRRGALDVADEGRDLNCFVGRHGILLSHCEVWSGKGSDIFATTERAFLLTDTLKLDGFDFDSDGLGAGVRGDADRIASRREENRLPKRDVRPYRGSAAVLNPDDLVPSTERTNADMFQNLKAQAYWNLRNRFLETFRAMEGKDYDPDSIISIDSHIADLQKLIDELSQPRWKFTATGKYVVDKAPDGAASPNRADATCIAWAQITERYVLFTSDSDDADDLY